MIDTIPTQKKRSNGEKRILVLISAIIISGLVALPTAMIFFIGLLPTIVAFVIDGTKAKTTARTVGFSNLVGVFVVVIELWKVEHSIDYAFGLLADPLNWLYMYFAASIGWIINIFFRWSASKYLHTRGIMLLKNLKKRRERLISEFGEENLSSNAPELPFSDEQETAMLSGEKTARNILNEIKKQKRLENPDMFISTDDNDDEDDDTINKSIEEEENELRELMSDYQDVQFEHDKTTT